MVLAFNYFTVFEKLPLKIECIESWGNQYLLVGTTEGALFIYEIIEKNETGRNSPFMVSLLDAQKNFSKKPIVQLTAIDQLKILVSLSDGNINIHDLPSFHLRSQLNKAKGCHLYVIDIQPKGNTNSIIVTLCAAIKKKIFLFTWDGADFTETKELTLPDSAKSIVFCGTGTLCIGFKKEYNMLNINTGHLSELFPTGKNGIPQACLLRESSQILLGKDNMSIFIGFDGKPTKRYALTWSEQPITLASSFPYVLSVLSKGIEVRSISGTQNLIQTIPLKSPHCISVKDNVNVYVGSQNNVWKLIPVPIVNQVDQLVQEKEYEEALTLCENITDNPIIKENKMKSIKEFYAYYLFNSGQYERAMEYFLELSMDPLTVIGFYPNLLPKNLKEKMKNTVDIIDLTGAALDKALQALSTYLLKIRVIYQKIKKKNPTTQDESLSDDFATTKDMLTIIDTSLLKAYIKTNDNLLIDLVKKENYCHIRECEKTLLNYKKNYELVLFYKGKNLHRNALDLLAKLYQQGTKHNVSSSFDSLTETISYLQQLDSSNLNLIIEFSKWVIQADPNKGLMIFTNRNNYLSPSVILPHIKSLAPQLTVPYLENLIQEKKEQGADFHDELIICYLDIILSIKKEDSQQNKDLLLETRKKLISFLEQSPFYRAEKMLSRFPSDDLFEERAILLSRIHQHEKALQIYAHKLNNFQMAENYCLKHYNPEKEESRDIYLSLLKVYLKPPEPIQPMVKPALLLLNRYYEKLDIAKALDLLPSETKINELYGVFESVLRENSKNKRNNQVIKNLLKSENLQVREQLIRVHSRVIKIDEDRMCPVCNKRLGTSVFACYPNGVVVHYACCKDKNVCPVTKTVFNKNI